MKFCWTEKEQLALEKLKNSLLEDATLAYYAVGVETEVVVDACPVHLCAVLIQKKEEVIFLSFIKVEPSAWLSSGTARQNRKL